MTFPVVDGKSVANSVLQVLLSALSQALEDVVWLLEDVEQEMQRDILGRHICMPCLNLSGVNCQRSWRGHKCFIPECGQFLQLVNFWLSKSAFES